jgi:phosphatidylglycerol:prolipoprotein diacylglycerol transferase
MYPEIFHIPFLHTYGVLVALAFLAGLWMATHLARRDALNADAVTNLGIYCALAAIVGAKVMMLLVDPQYRDNPREIFTWDTLQAGGIFYGGLLAALAVEPPTYSLRQSRWATESGGWAAFRRAAAGAWNAICRGR